MRERASIEIPTPACDLNTMANTFSAHLRKEDAAVYASTCDRFDVAWKAARAGEPQQDLPAPVIEDFVSSSLNQALRIALLTELVKLDLEYRSRGQERVPVRDYLQRFRWLPKQVGATEPQAQ